MSVDRVSLYLRFLFGSCQVSCLLFRHVPWRARNAASSSRHRRDDGSGWRTVDRWTDACGDLRPTAEKIFLSWQTCSYTTWILHKNDYKLTNYLTSQRNLVENFRPITKFVRRDSNLQLKQNSLVVNTFCWRETVAAWRNQNHIAAK